ncbi:MAG: hypothetical protein ABR985_04800 [Methanotrichaceae archaeon]|jgi:hypothetical protein
MISEWMLRTLLDYAKNGIIAGISEINQKDFDSALNKTLIEFEHKYFGFSRTSFKDFISSSEFQIHLEHHLTDKDLDLEYLGGILSKYVNLEKGMSPKMLLQDFYDKLEMNLSRNPQLKAQLDLRA